ncbi:MAG: MaoC family dehydratase [Candidatus Hydrogenedentes bacterium]|nr:MaoC family dehydratase [Candidatus Hydrogenedentota bacterium]
MPPREVTIGDLESMLGQDIGASDWLTMTQDRVQRFADATNDRQWIHVDPERALRESPFGGPIAHGYLTLSLISGMMEEIWTFKGVAMALNYGLNKVRFPSPVRVGARIRAAAKLLEVTPLEGGVQCVVGVTIEIEGQPKPACVAESVFRLLG